MQIRSTLPFALGSFLAGITSVTAEITMVPLIRLRESATGGSEFVDEFMPLDVYNKLGNLSEPFTTGPLQFRVTGEDYGTGVNAVPHNAPNRQFVITLQGSLNITVIDKFENGTTQRGEERHLEAGDLLFVEDTNGTGHYAVNANGGKRISFFYPVAVDELVYEG